jgi:CBS domain-containing protein
MTSRPAAPATSRLFLDAATAADLMSSQVLSIHADATIPEAAALLTERGISAAPVIEESGRPVGVVSRGDILIPTRETALRRAPGDPALVRDIMTPALFSVTPETPAANVVEQLLTLNVDQLYVVDDSESVVAVIGVHDVLRRLRGG